MKYLAVFCGSKSGNDNLYTLHAQQLGGLMAQLGYGLVYGGGNKGLMGTIADAVMEHGGKVTGIMPERLAEYDHSHTSITELLVVPDMHTRKKKLYQYCEAAIILPGGYGTMDEMFEMLTWNQLAIHNKPIYILNTNGYYSDLFQMMQVMHLGGFLHEPLQKRVRIFEGPEPLLNDLHSLLCR